MRARLCSIDRDEGAFFGEASSLGIRNFQMKSITSVDAQPLLWSRVTAETE
jgi:hypothetical protein